MRSYHKGWQTDRPLKPDSRRVKYYKGAPGESIRVQFEDQFGRISLYFDTPEEANEAYEAFIADESITSITLRNSANVEPT